MMFHGAFLAFQNSYLLAEEGTIDVPLREAITAAILGVKDTPGTQRYWRQRRGYLHADFARYVDDLFDRESDTGMDIYRDSRASPE